MEIVSATRCTICGRYAPAALTRLMLDWGNDRWRVGWLCSRCKTTYRSTKCARFPEEIRPDGNPV